MSTDLTLYQCSDLIEQIEALAEQSNGEITEAQLEAFVVAQTTAIEKVGKLAGFIKFCERWLDMCKAEENRLASKRRVWENRLASIEKFLMPFVKNYRDKNGHPFSVGTFTLSTRHSTSVEVDELSFFTQENQERLCIHKESWIPDKAKIKEALKAGEEVMGARLDEKDSLQVR